MSTSPVRAVLADTSLRDDPALLDAASLLFDYVQFLLDDDENLTPGGNLTGKARERLRVRAGELLSGGAAVDIDSVDLGVEGA